jgi:hypothetical protein
MSIFVTTLPRPYRLCGYEGLEFTRDIFSRLLLAHEMLLLMCFAQVHVSAPIGRKKCQSREFLLASWQ